MSQSTVSSGKVAIPADRMAMIVAGLKALRAANVEPMALALDVGGDGQLAWGWYKYKARITHPNPGNARRGYSHPTDLSAFAASCNARGGAPILTVQDVAGMDEDALYRRICLPILHACGLVADDFEATYAWHGLRSDGLLSNIDLARGGVQPWADYPDAGLPAETEIIEGYDRPVLHYGGEREKQRVRKLYRNERESTDQYMQRVHVAELIQ